MKAFYDMLGAKLGVAVATIIVIALCVVAWYLHTTPGGVLEWMGR